MANSFLALMSYLLVMWHCLFDLLIQGADHEQIWTIIKMKLLFFTNTIIWLWCIARVRVLNPVSSCFQKYCSHSVWKRMLIVLSKGQCCIYGRSGHLIVIPHFKQSMVLLCMTIEFSSNEHETVYTSVPHLAIDYLYCFS
jgi:hypothetical protein